MDSINTMWTGLVLRCSMLSQHDIEQGVKDTSGRIVALDPDIQEFIQGRMIPCLHNLGSTVAYSFTWDKECHPKHIHSKQRSNLGNSTVDLGALELSEDRCEKFRNGLYEHLQSERTALGYTFMNRLWLLIDLLHVEGACCVFCRAAWIENLKQGREEAWSRAAYGVMMMSESVGVTE